jgi:hypothetical protein
MTVTNLTDTVVNGKALEGTVNRFLFQLKAGATESCFDIEYSVTVSTTIVTTDGTTADVNPEDGVSPSTEVDMAKVVTGKRTPVIVSPDEAGIGHRSTGFGYDLPPGWRLEGTGHASDKAMHHVRNLQAGDSTYISFEMYRPSCTLKPLENPYDSERTNVDEYNQDEVCQTDFDISISYRQSRPAIQKAGEEESQKELSDSVVLEHHGSVLWESPLVADFSIDGRSQQAFPSGSRHPSNYISSTETVNSGSSGASPELSLINLERTTARCVLRSKVADDGLGIELSRIGFEVMRRRCACFVRNTVFFFSRVCLFPLIPLVSIRRKIFRSTRAKLLANSTFNLVVIQPHRVYYSNLRTMIPLAYLQTDQSLV